MIRFGGRVDRHKTEATSLLVCQPITILGLAHFGVAHSENINFIAKTIYKFAGIRQAMGRAIGMGDLQLVGPPPARIAHSDGWRAERPVAVSLLFDAILAKRGQVLVAIDVQGH